MLNISNGNDGEVNTNEYVAPPSDDVRIGVPVASGENDGGEISATRVVVADVALSKVIQHTTASLVLTSVV